MLKMFRISSFRYSLMVFLVISIYTFEIDCSTNLTKSRVRRRVVFTKSSKFFFRFNGKLNTLSYNQVVACGYTVRMNFDMPHDVKSRFTFFKRDIHEDISSIPDESAVRGFSCVMNHVCQVFSNFEFSDTCGIFCDLGRIIARDEGNEANFIKKIFSKCSYYKEVCNQDVPVTTTIGYV